jgi:integrase
MFLSSDDPSQALTLPESRGLLDQNPAAVYLAGLNSKSGRRTMRQVLDLIARTLSNGQLDALDFPWWQLRYQHTQAVRAWLVETYKPATANKALCALRGVLKQAWMLGYMTAEDYHKAREVKSVRGQTVPAGRELSREEIRALLGVCEGDSSPAGIRDAALLALLYGAGLRRAEVVALDLGDYDPQASQLLIKGKGRKERVAYLNDSLNRAMGDWLEVRGFEPGPLFLPIRKDGDLELRRMTTQAVYNLLRKRAAQARVRNFSPHDLRRTFVSDLLEAGADIAIVAKMAGHANVQTTARYDRRPEEAKRRAANLLDVPYRGLRNITTDNSEK